MAGRAKPADLRLRWPRPRRTQSTLPRRPAAMVAMLVSIPGRTPDQAAMPRPPPQPQFSQRARHQPLQRRRPARGATEYITSPGGAGAPGGSATASAEDSGAANTSAIASATGGAGGYGVGGGVASGVTAYASGTASALASAEQTGGNSGGGRYSGPEPGVSSTLTNAVSGETDGGNLTLEQTAVGGEGGYSVLGGGSDGARRPPTLPSTIRRTLPRALLSRST